MSTSQHVSCNPGPLCVAAQEEEGFARAIIWGGGASFLFAPPPPERWPPRPPPPRAPGLKQVQFRCGRSKVAVKADRAWASIRVVARRPVPHFSFAKTLAPSSPFPSSLNVPPAAHIPPPTPTQRAARSASQQSLRRPSVEGGPRTRRPWRSPAPCKPP
jgi:hypothetical protein